MTLSLSSPTRCASEKLHSRAPISLSRPLHPRLATLALGLFTAAAIGLAGAPAEAACTPDPPADDDAVTCDGTDSTGFDGSGVTGLTLTTDGAAELDESGALDSAILVSDDNTVTIGTDATLTVTETDGFGVRGGDRNTVTNDGTIVVDGTNGVAIDVGSLDDPDPVPQIDVMNTGTITLNGANSVGLRSVDNYNLSNEAGATISIGATATGGIGLQGQDDNLVFNRGTITVDAADGRAISIRDNTGVALPNGAIADSTSVINLNGDRSIAVEARDNVGVAIDGIVNFSAFASETRGLSAGNKTDPFAEANFTNQGTMNVASDDAFGMKVGDGWIDGSDDGMGVFVPELPGTRNLGTIDVTGNGSIGIFAGDDTNLAGDHDSFVWSLGTLGVTGTDATGISLGGNDVFAPFDFDDFGSNINLFTLDNADIQSGLSSFTGVITGDADAGPLVVFRNFVAGRENRLRNTDGASILADLTNLGTPDRGIAIRGTNGIELVMNAGAIQGDIELLDGDDRYAVDSTATLTGTVFGGAGSDEAVLNFVSGTEPGNFDAAQLDGFERIRIYGMNTAQTATTGWTLSNAASFAGVTEVAPNGRLVVPEDINNFNVPVALGGDLVVDPNGSVLLNVDGTNTPLTVMGDATFDGTLVVDTTTRLLNRGGTFRLIQVDGSRGATTFANEMLPGSAGAFSFSTLYDTDGVSLVAAFNGAADIARGANRRAIARHLDELFLDPTTPIQLQGEISDLFMGTGNLNLVFDALNPEPYDAQTTLIAEGSRQVASLLLNRPRNCRPGELDRWQGLAEALKCHSRSWSPWLATVGGFRKRDAFSGHPEYDSEIGGAVFGIDARPIGDLDFTLAISSQRGQVDVQGYGESDLVLADVSGHVAWNLGALRLQGVATWGYGVHNSRRRIQFDEGATPVNANTEDDFGSQHVALSAQAGYLMNLGPIDIEPIAGIDYTWISQEAVHEQDGGLYSLRIQTRKDEIVSAVAGVRLSTLYHHAKYLHTNLLWMDGTWQPILDLRWREVLSGAERSLTGRLTGAPDTVGSFSVDGLEDKGGLEVGAGVSFVPENADRLQFDLRYEAYRAAHTLQHNLVAKVVLGF
ncbi:MAG: autotransporter domain-containing protein [bacterium]|nr:autotransporter domain-containing protein [bacterium]